MSIEKIRIKSGEIEVEYEGEREFARAGAIGLFEKVLELAPIADRPSVPDEQSNTSRPDPISTASNGMTISTIAARLEPKGTQDLVRCALARLQILLGQESASKDEIWEEMRGATGYFKSSMNKNFPRDLSRMVTGKKIMEVAKNVYTLSALERKALEAEIVEIE